MTRRATRLVIWLLLAAAIAGAAYFLLTQHQRAEARRAHDRAVEDLAAQLRAGVTAVRTGQQAYVAPGQSEEWWRGRVAGALDGLHGGIEDLRQLAADPAALNDLDAAAAAVARLAAVDGQARRAIGFAETTRAATLVFGDGLAAAGEADRRLAAAAAAERAAGDRTRGLFRAREAAIAGSAALAALLAALVFALTGRTRSGSDVVGTTTDAAIVAQDAAERPPAPAAAERAEPAGEAAGAEWPAARDRRKAPELRAAADLCTDFARFGGEQELPALLERTARLLDATGIIIWVAAPGTGALSPLLAHGYSQQALARMPTIPADDDNATAAAYRNADLEVVKTNGMSPGAVAVPLMTSAGCVGVMAAEVRHGREASESARALARIVAAQFATLVGPAQPQAQQEPDVLPTAAEATG